MTIGGSLEGEKRRWHKDVEEEAARLIRTGVDPDDATEQAKRNICDRRSRQTTTFIP